MLKTFCLFLLFGASFLGAAEPIAVVTADVGLTINGKAIKTAGAPNWPVAAGDELVTGTANAVLSFPDGARLTLEPNTKVALKSCDRCVVQLFQGSVDYSKPAGSKLEMCALGHPVRPVSGSEGSVRIDGSGNVVVKVADKEHVASSGTCACKAGAPWAATASHTKLAVIVAAGGAAVAATSVAVTRGAAASTK
jgi:hypothetical protein